MSIRIILGGLILVSILHASGGSMVLESRESMSIRSLTSAEYTVYKKILIDDERGKDLANLSIWTNDYIKLKNVKVAVYDKKGKRQKRYKKKHFSQKKPSSYGVIGHDDISYQLNLASVSKMPFSLEIEYTKNINSLFFWPDWSPQEQIPVVTASYTLEVPDQFEFSSFSPSNIQYSKPSATTYLWSQSDIPVWPDEISLPYEVYDRHKVFFAPHGFRLDQYEGDMSTWDGMADFYADLASTQYAINPELLSDLHFKTASSLRDSIALIYDYVQRSTRYVAMELGLHGWKPHSGQWVCENRYGDCKDLATFFISILRIYHIEAYPALILTRSRGVTYPEFPNNRFNHAIACVPLDTDTLWVDCTDDDGRIDIIHQSNQGCNVLVVGGKGPVLARTPVQTPDKNTWLFEGDIEMTSNGVATIKGQLKFIGHASKQTRSSFQSIILRDQREAILGLFSESAPGLVLDTFSVENLDEKYAPLIIKLEGHIPHFATQTGQRFFVYPALPSKAEWYGEHPSRRTEPFSTSIPFLSSSEIDLHVSDRWELESTPQDVAVNTAFGEINQSVTVQGNDIHYSWRRSGLKLRIEQNEYKDYYDYRLTAKQAQASPLVFKFK